jgi:transcription elongation GreA/GreB family factor
MSRAFVKESDKVTSVLPERAISAHPNFVTPRGLALLDARIRDLEARRRAARAANDFETIDSIARDLRYYQNRRETARLMQPLAAPSAVRFGVQVRLRTASGAEPLWRVVGEDEADPARGLLSYVSPLAMELMGCGVGDTVELPTETAVIIGLD